MTVKTKSDPTVEVGDWVVYRAANWHLMEGEVTGFYTFEGVRMPRIRSWDAEHSDQCHCGGRESLPDW